MNDLDALQAQELACLRKFRARAAKLLANDPGMSKRLALTKAIEAMPNTLELYMATTQRLKFMGVASAPLW